MTPLQRRIFIFLDEWLGILLLVYLDRTGSWLFWWVFAAWVLMIYVISYPTHWLQSTIFEGSHADNVADKVAKGRARGWPKGKRRGLQSTDHIRKRMRRHAV